MEKSLAAALRENPFLIAGFSIWPEDEEKCLLHSLDILRRSILDGSTLCHSPASVVFAMVRVAQEDYGADADEGYWPVLAKRLEVGQLDMSQQRNLGEAFSRALAHFGYPPGRNRWRHVGPVLWHAGCPRNQFPALLEFIVAQVDIYGDRAADTDAIHALRVGETAASSTWQLRLPRTVRRLINDSPDGIGEFWASVAETILAYRRNGEADARQVWANLAGIPFTDIREALQKSRLASPSQAMPRRPQLRYHADTGELRLWLMEENQKSSDWDVRHLCLRWEGRSALVLPPLSPSYQLIHRGTGQSWIEDLYTQHQAIWFGGRTGVLERANAIDTRGLTPGPWHVLLHGSLLGWSVQHRRPLELAFLKGGEGWSAWQIDVPSAPSFALRVGAEEWSFPLTRASAPTVAPAEPVLRGTLEDGSPISVYAEPPELEIHTPVRLLILRRDSNGAELVHSVSVDHTIRLPDLGSGVFQLRLQNGVQRVLLDYAVIPGFACAGTQISGQLATVGIRGRDGTLAEAQPIDGGWRLQQGIEHPWLEGRWTWQGTSLPIRLRWPVRAVRWRVLNMGDGLGAWMRQAPGLDRRLAISRDASIEIEVPSADDVSINGTQCSSENMSEFPTGYRFVIRVASYPSAEEIILNIQETSWTVAWLSERPVLRHFDVTADAGHLLLEYKAEHLPGNAVVGFWDPLDPSAPIQTCRLVDLVPTPVRPNHGFLAVAIGSQVRQGFAPARFHPARRAGSDQPLIALVSLATAAPTVEYLHAWSNHLRFGADAPQQPAGTLDWPLIRKFADQIARLKSDQSPRQDAVLAAIQDLFGRALPDAFDEMSRAADPSTIVVNWLDVEVHPGWHNSPEWTSPKITPGYPWHYFAALATLNNRAASIGHRREAAEFIEIYHDDRQLFPPTLALPLARVLATPSLCLTLHPDTPHRHRFIRTPKPTDLVTFSNQVLGEDCNFHADYVSLPYSIGWDNEEDRWDIERRVPAAHPGKTKASRCCSHAGPLVAPGWEAGDLVSHLGLFDWLTKRSEKAPDPRLDLSAEFDDLLFGSPLRTFHRRVLESPPIENQVLYGVRVPVPAYSDLPAAAKWAWRLAWLDRLGTEYPQQDWRPFLRALARALRGPQPFTNLLIDCLAVAEYIRTILAGGIGHAFRFLPAQPEMTR